MTPLIPRMHLFEIDDQPWQVNNPASPTWSIPINSTRFPSFLRARVQAALTAAWTTHVPVLQSSSPAQLAARILSTNLGASIRDYVFIDFCAGAGGPTPYIEKHLNQTISNGASTPTAPSTGTSYAAVAAVAPKQPVRFVLTDLHPHVADWRRAAAASPNISFVPEPVDAAHAPTNLLERYKKAETGAEGAKKVFRLFNLAFHHFDDPLAKAILKNTVETSDGFGIFELQDRSFLGGFVTLLLFGIGIVLTAPYYAVKWRSPATLLFTYLIPVLPLVLVFDGWVSALRTRTADEVEALLRTCGAEGGEEEIARWEVRSGKTGFMWPVGKLNWIVCVRKGGGR